MLEADDGRLIQMISSDTLNAQAQSEYNAGASTLFWLAGWDYGRALLLEHRSLREMISPEGLNAVVDSGDCKGQSALFWLARNQVG